MSESIGPSLIVFEFKSIAKGYSAVAFATRDNSIKILEATPVNPGKFLLIAHGSPADCKKKHHDISEKFKAEIIESTELESINKEVLFSLYGQSKETPHEALLFIETANVSSALLGAHAVLAKVPLKIIEFKAARAIGGKSLLIFTGTKSECHEVLLSASDFFGQTKALIAAEIVEQPSPEFLSLFQL